MNINWIVEPELWEGHANAMKLACSGLGHSIHFTDIALEKKLPILESPVFVHGSFQLARKIHDEGLDYRPGVICSIDNFLWTNYAPKLKAYLLNDQWELSRLSELETSTRNETLTECFVRPVRGDKPFGGIVFSGDRVLWLAQAKMMRRYAEANVEIIICRLKKIEAEYRMIIVNNQVISGCRYMLDDCIDPDETVPDGATKLAQEIALGDWQPDWAYVVDIAQISSGFRLLELNGFSTSDWYCCPVASILKAIEKSAY